MPKASRLHAATRHRAAATPTLARGQPTSAAASAARLRQTRHQAGSAGLGPAPWRGRQATQAVLYSNLGITCKVPVLASAMLTMLWGQATHHNGTLAVVAQPPVLDQVARHCRLPLAQAVQWNRLVTPARDLRSISVSTASVNDSPIILKSRHPWNSKSCMLVSQSKAPAADANRRPSRRTDLHRRSKILCSHGHPSLCR
jgi:hypothetical protein